MGLFSKIKDKMSSNAGDFGDEEVSQQFNEEYIELGHQNTGSKAKVSVRSFVVEDFADIKPVLDTLREGYTIALVNIGPLKEKDPVELRRAVSKLKKTSEALEGDIAGFSEDWVVITPGFASVYRERGPQLLKEE